MTTEKNARRQLLDLLQRMIAFLTGVGNDAMIRAALAQRGYSKSEHAAGWSLFHAVSGINAPFPSDSTEAAVRDAIASIDAWDEPTFRTMKPALTRMHPDQAKFVFENLEPQTGLGSVISVETFLDRIDALESSPDRAATREADLAAIATLESRGITAAVRAEMRAKVAIAKTGSMPLEVPQDPSQKDVLAMQAWLADWTETAKTYIKRRDQLIRLGLSKRKRAKRDDAETTEPVAPTLPGVAAPPVVPAPVAPAPNGALPAGAPVV